MKMSAAQEKKLKKLRNVVEYHRQKYHTEDTPEISDEAFDALLRELQELEIFLGISEYAQENKKIGTPLLMPTNSLTSSSQSSLGPRGMRKML
jgi:NAD-dependent DNA ligase